MLSVAVLAATILLTSGATAEAAAPRSFFGIAPALPPPPGDSARMAQGGIGTMRFLIHWPAIQPTPGGPYNWSEVDKQVAAAGGGGITILPFFYGTPTWASQCAGIDPLCELYSPTLTATGRAGWAALLSAAVARYGPSGSFWTDTTDAHNPPYLPIRIWQIWNEENSRKFALPLPPSVGRYYQLLKISKQAISSVDPGAKIATGGLFGLPSKPGIPIDKFLDRLYRKKGAKRLFDVVAIHPYTPNRRKLLLQLRQARDTMKANKDRKTPLLITEIGFGSAPPGSEPGQGSLSFGPEGQAAMISRILGFLASHRRRFNLDAVYYFTWRDTPPGTGGTCYLCESGGLLNGDGSTKPAYFAYAQVAG